MRNRKRSKKRTKKVDKKYLISLAKKYKVNYKSLSNKKIAKNLSQTYLTKKAKLYILPLLPNNRKKSLKRKKGGAKIETTSTDVMIVTRQPPDKITLETNIKNAHARTHAKKHLYNFFKDVDNKNNFDAFDFINFKTDFNKDNGKITFTFSQSIFKGFTQQHMKWRDIACDEKVENGITYKTDCDVLVRGKSNILYTTIKSNDEKYPRTQKVFFKIENKGVPGVTGDIRHLYDYIKNIQSDEISETDHNTIFEKVFENLFFLHKNGFQFNVINHNFDVPFLHFKFV